MIVLAIRGRRFYDNCHPFLKDKGETMKDETRKRVSRFKTIAAILTIWPIPDKDFVHPFSVSERTVSMDSHSF